MAQPQRVASFIDGRDHVRPIERSHEAVGHATLIQSRETGQVVPDDSPPEGQVKALPFAKSWVHFMAGGYVGRRRIPRPTLG